MCRAWSWLAAFSRFLDSSLGDHDGGARSSAVFGLALQLFCQAVFGHRPREEVSLAEVAPHFHQGLQIRCRFDSLRDRQDVSLMRKLDDGFADTGGDRVAIASGNIA